MNQVLWLVAHDFLNYHWRRTHKKIKTNLQTKQIYRLVILGGDGSAAAGVVLSQLSLQISVIPCSIDNDYSLTSLTIGASSAMLYNQQLIRV